MMRTRPVLSKVLHPLLLALCLALGVPTASAVERADLQAAILYNLLAYVEWPADLAPPTGGDLVLCMDGASPLKVPVRSLEGRPVGRARLALRRLESSDPARGCHAVFLDAAEPGGAAPKRRVARGPGLLLISDTAPQPDDGVTIRLGQAEGRLVFDVDLNAAREARLQISSRLLRLARKVIG